jgi:pimeloyl-ACP methyl ester carboxylesterase
VRRSAALVAALLSVVIAASGCTARTPSPQPTPSPGDSSHPVSWVDCRSQARDTNADLPRSINVECGTVQVPEDWAHVDNGKTFDIAVMRMYSGNADDKKGSVLTNPGGPGGSGLDFLPYLAPKLTSLMSQFIMVTFDPRGVGKSDPVDCISDADLDASFGYEPDPADQASFDGNVALVKRIAKGCGDKYSDELGLFSTEQTARDMDAIRSSVGDEKLTYLGFSYGTLLGAVYAEIFPTKVRAMVLDGAVDPQQSPVQASEGQAMGFERALTNFTAWCKTNTSRCPIAADPKGAITAALAKARTSPVKGSDGRLATPGWVLWGVIFAMYSQDNWKYVGPALDDLSRGDAGLIFAMADSYAERDKDGHYSNLFDANNAVNCADAESPSIDEIRSLQSQWRTKYPLFGAPLAIGLLNCSVWPAKKDPYPVGPAKGAPPILVVGTTGDPATPYESTMKLADMLGVGQVLTWEGEGHTAYPTTTCIRRAVDNYLIDLTLPAKGLRCPAS